MGSPHARVHCSEPTPEHHSEEIFSGWWKQSSECSLFASIRGIVDSCCMQNEKWRNKRSARMMWECFSASRKWLKMLRKKLVFHYASSVETQGNRSKAKPSMICWHTKTSWEGTCVRQYDVGRDIVFIFILNVFRCILIRANSTLFYRYLINNIINPIEIRNMMRIKIVFFYIALFSGPDELRSAPLPKLSPRVMKKIDFRSHQIASFKMAGILQESLYVK